MLLAAALLTSAATTVDLSMVSANAIEGEMPFALFGGAGWHADANAEYVKLHLYFDAPFDAAKVEVTSCGKPFTASISVFVNFDQHIATLERAGTGAKADLGTIAGGVSSLTFNFGRQRQLCLAGVKVLDRAGAPVELRVPKVVKGTMTASSTTKPLASYSILNVFDSRFEYAWASDKATKGVVLEATFEEEQTLDRLRVWNGYQRSAVHCWANSRIKKMKLTGDGGYEAVVELTDVMGAQTIALPKPFKGKRLTMTVEDAFMGKTYKDLVVSELRFGAAGGGWLTLDPLAQIQGTVRDNKASFDKVKLAGVLDHGLVGSNSVREDNATGDWTLRLRSDGSFFLEGETSEETDELSQKTQEFYALGNYEVKKVGKDELKLRLFGYLRVYKTESDLEMDCNGCGRPCAGGGGDEDTTEKIFEEYVVVKAFPKGIRFSNESGKNLNFKTLWAREEGSSGKETEL
jgi:hypothetical protein